MFKKIFWKNFSKKKLRLKILKWGFSKQVEASEAIFDTGFGIPIKNKVGFTLYTFLFDQFFDHLWSIPFLTKNWCLANLKIGLAAQPDQAESWKVASGGYFLCSFTWASQKFATVSPYGSSRNHFWKFGSIFRKKTHFLVCRSRELCARVRMQQ